MIVGMVRSLPLKDDSLGQAPGFYTNIKRLANDKHPILLRTFVNYGRKRFMTLGQGRYLQTSCRKTYDNYHCKCS
jgi:hypothetical protein